MGGLLFWNTKGVGTQPLFISGEIGRKLSLSRSQGEGGLAVSERRTGSEELVVTEATGTKHKGTFPYPEVSKIVSKLKEGFHS